MKRLHFMLLVLAASAILVGCGGNTNQITPTVEAKTESAADSRKNEEENAENKPEPTKEAAAFEEITVIDNEKCLVKITDLDPDNGWGYTVKAYVENRSAEKNFMFSVKSAAVNGIETDPLFATTVAAGKKSREEISFFDQSLYAPDVGNFTDIELVFLVTDSDDWSADNIAQETVHIYPYGEEKAAKYVRSAQPGDVVLADNDAVSVIVTGVETNSFGGYTVNLYLVNKTDDELMFAVDDVSVNGFMADPFWASSVQGGKVSFSSMSWSSDTLEKNEITTVEEIEMTLRASDYNNWSAPDVLNETVTFKP